MSYLKGGQDLWVSASIGQNDVSKLAFIGPGPHVAIYIANEGGTFAATFDIEVAATADPAPGRNALDATSSGGLVWHKLHGFTGIVVAAGTQVAYNLAPFAPPFLRLIRTDATGATAVSAKVSSLG